MPTARSVLVILACACLSACTAALTGSAGALSVLAVLAWVVFAGRSSAADGGSDPAPSTIDGGVPDMASDAALEVVARVCLCMAHPGAAPSARIAVPGFDPLAIQARVRAALPADVQARLKD